MTGLFSCTLVQYILPQWRHLLYLGTYVLHSILLHEDLADDCAERVWGFGVLERLSLRSACALCYVRSYIHTTDAPRHAPNRILRIHHRADNGLCTRHRD